MFLMAYYTYLIGSYFIFTVSLLKACDTPRVLEYNEKYNQTVHEVKDVPTEVPSSKNTVSVNDSRRCKIVKLGSLALAVDAMDVDRAMQLLAAYPDLNPAEALNLLKQKSTHKHYERMRLVLLAQVILFKIKLAEIKKIGALKNVPFGNLPWDLFPSIFEYSMGTSFPKYIYPVFHYAIRLKDEKLCGWLIAKGFSPEDGLPLYREHLGTNQSDIIAFPNNLHEIPFDHDLGDLWSPPLHYAAAYSGEFTAIVELLIKNGAQVNRIDTGTGETALHRACRKYSSDIVTLLLQHGADWNMKDREDQTPWKAARNVLATHCALCIERYEASLEEREADEIDVEDEGRQINESCIDTLGRLCTIS